MWCWSKLSSAQWEDAWNERLSGNPNAVITYIKGGKSIRIEVFCENPGDAEFLKEYFGGSVREVKTQDWVASQANFNRPPLKIRDKVLITENPDLPYQEELRRQYPERALICIPAELAFGTGDHATTSTCMRLIADYAGEHKNKPWSMLDLGCGTGILALAARMLGAESALGMDFDPVAVKVSRSNAERNNHPEVAFFQGDVFEWNPEPGQKWNLVAANLFSTILQKAFPRIVRTIAEKGQLVVSGILATQWEETRQAGEAAGLTFTQVIKKGKWVTARGNLTVDCR